LKEVEDRTTSKATIASSSSGFLVAEIQKHLKHPERFLVVHPFNPPHLIPLVEVVPGRSTSKETTNTAYDFMTEIGKVPIILKKEAPGYVANRLQAALWREAMDLLDKGVASAEDIDKSIYAGPGIRWAMMGPFLQSHLEHSKGIRYHFKAYESSLSSCWKSMNAWTRVPPSAKKKVIKEVERMDTVRSNTVAEISMWRNENLMKLLRILDETRAFYDK
jgi:3-hydroxypropionate dehydrogenase (NADP+)